MHALTHVSLLNGFVPAGVAGVAVAVFALVPRVPGWRRHLVTGAVLAGVLVVAVGKLVGIEQRVGSSFPPSFYLWAALPLASLLAVTPRWAGLGYRGRAAALTATACLAVFGAGEVNAHYGYYPTVGDLLGASLPDQPGRATKEVIAVADRPMSGGSLVTASPPPPTDAAAPSRGLLVTVRVPATASRFRARPALVWLPPVYFSRPRPSLPVIMLMGGVPGRPADLIRAAGAVTVADTYASTHDGTAPILVFPDQNGAFFSDTECVDGPRGNAETYLATDVVTFLSSQFGARPTGWGIIGFSEGGTCAVTLSLRQPRVFSALVDIAGDVRPVAARGPRTRHITVERLYGGDARQWATHDPAALLQTRVDRPLAASFYAGQQDHNGLDAVRKLNSLFGQAGLPTSLSTGRGGHSFFFVKRTLKTALPQLADRLLSSRS